MPHHNTLFHDLLKRVPWDKLTEAVARHSAHECARGFTFKSHLIALVYGQLHGCSSLRDIEAGLRSHANRLYHVGAAPPRRSSLADANRDRPAAVFSDVLASMMQHAQRNLRRTMREATYLIDSTTIRLNSFSAGWARFSSTAINAKLHVVYNPDADRPVHALVSAGRILDIAAARQIPIVPSTTYVFDLGYYDYSWWARLDAAGCRVVTRLKSSTPFKVTETRPINDGASHGAILSDRIGRLPQRQSHSRRNPMGGAMRQIEVRIETGKVLRVFTNDLVAPACEIADLYKRRWAIELFFRWVKQMLRITRFLGTSENAVRIQLTAALIAFMLLRMAQATQTAIHAPITFARLVRANLMHTRAVATLAQPPPRQKHDHGQGSLFAT